MFFKKNKKRVFISRLLVATGVIMVWRSLWNFLDMFFLPEYEILSNALTLILGILILYVPDKDIKELIN